MSEQLRLDIPFTIRSTIGSSTTTISGTITNPYPWVGGWFGCNGSALLGFGVGANNAKYTATIQRQNQPAQPISGNAQITGGFSIVPGATTTVTETLAFP
jgi:hypothetical protein